MVGNVESRRAGKSLLAIIATLILPLLLLGGLYVRQAWQSIHFIDDEITGLQLAQKIYTALIFDDYHWSDEEFREVAVLEARLSRGSQLDFKAHVKGAPETETETGETDGHQAAKGEHATQAAEVHEHEDPISGYLTDVGDISGLILDSDARSFHLINALVVQLPKTIDDYETLVRRLSGDAKGASGLVLSAVEAQQMLGRVYGSFDALSESVEAANRNATFESPEEYQAHKAQLGKIRSIIHGSEMKLGQLTFTSTGLSKNDNLIVQKSMDNIRVAAKGSSTMGFAVLNELMQERRSAKVREAVVLGAFAMASAILALFLSLFMIRRTFVQLDKVTELHASAEAARFETERINSEVALLNRDLTNNMEKLKLAQDEIVNKGRMEQLGQLTATIAHEIRNPLGAVRTSAFLLERKISGKGLGVESQLQRINAGVVRCDNIITQLLDYSRNKQLACSLGNLDEWLANTVRDIAEKLPEAVYTECTLGLNDRLVPFDGARLQRAIENLMRNASEAMVGTGDDPGKFSVEHPRIWVSTCISGADVMLTVRDNGPGISAENLGKVREPLFTTKSFGTGLGVPAIEQIAKQHGGRLEIASEVGVGSIFTIHIPLEEKSQEAA